MATGKGYTVTVASASAFAPGGMVFLTGVRDSSYDSDLSKDAVAQVETVTSTEIQLSVSGHSGKHAASSGGYIIPARWRLQKLKLASGDPAWFFCTPLGHAFFWQGVYAANYVADNTIWDGTNLWNLLKAKYRDPTKYAQRYQENWSLETARRLKSWHFNGLGAYASGYLLPTSIDKHGWLTADGSIPDEAKLPFFINLVPTYHAAYNWNGYAPQADKNLQSLVKRSVFKAWPTYAGAPDVFDPYFKQVLVQDIQNNENFNLYKKLHNDFLVMFDSDESDTTGWMKAGMEFPTWSGGRYDKSTDRQSEQFGWEVLISAPIAAGANLAMLPESGSSQAKNPVYPDMTNYTKQELANWLRGLTDPTTGASALRSGSAVTLSFSSPHRYIASELITVKGCSDISFNTKPGTGAVVTSTTSTTLSYTGAGAGRSATACTVTTGPGYGSVSALNAAWKSNYDSWVSDGAGQTDTLCAAEWDGANSACTLSLSKTPITPLTVQIKVNGKIILGDDAANVLRGTGDGGAFTDDSKKTRGTVTYSNGSGSITFATPPPRGAAVTASYQTRGWGAGRGLLDEDGTCPAMPQGGSCWVPADGFLLAGATKAMKVDLNNFLFHYSKQYFKTIQDVVDQVAPGTLLMCNDANGGWSSPPRAPILQASSAYCDLTGFRQIPLGPDPSSVATDNQARVDFIAKYFGDRPWLDYIYLLAQPDSSLAPYPPGDSSSKTQAERGAAYQDTVKKALSARVSPSCECAFAGTHPIAGVTWWGLYDDPVQRTSFGLVDRRDNPYDGRSDRPTRAKDAWGYPIGCAWDPPPLKTYTSKVAVEAGLQTLTPSSLGIGNFNAANPISIGTPLDINRGKPDQERLIVTDGGYYLNNNQISVNFKRPHPAGFTIDSDYPSCYLGEGYGDFLTLATQANRYWLNDLERAPQAKEPVRNAAPGAR